MSRARHALTRTAPTVRFAFSRVALGLVALLVVSVVVFGAVRLVPGSYADIVLGSQATEQARAALSERYGLDEPVTTQYVTWLGHAVRGDLGTSLRSGDSVGSEIVDRAGVTLELTLLGGLLALLVGYPLGVYGAVAGERKLFGSGVRVGNALFLSVPEILTGSILVYCFSVYELGLPVGGWVSLAESPWGNLQAAILPAVTVALVGIGFVMAASRGATSAVLAQPFVRAAVARGATRKQVVRRHVVRNTSVSVVTVFAIYLGYLVGGAVISELLFSLNGLGRYMVDAARQRDYVAVQGAVMAVAAAFIVLNTVVDILYGVLDPRIGQRRSR